MTRLLRDTGAVRRALLLGLLTSANALTEGAGVMLLVPMLAVLGADGRTPGWAGALLARIDPGLRLEVLLAGFVSMMALRALLGAARDLAALALETRVVDGLRLRCWRALADCDWQILSEVRSAQASSMLISHADRVGDGLHHLIALVTASATILAVGLAALVIAPQLAVGAVAGGLVGLLAFAGLRRRAAGLGAQLEEIYRTIHGRLAEGLGALRLIKSFGQEQASAEAVAQAFAARRRAQFGLMRSTGAGRVLYQACGAILLAGLVWLAIRRWNLGPAAVLPMVALFARALPLLGAVQDAWQHWAHERPAVAALFGFIDRLEAHAETAEGAGSALPAPGAMLPLALHEVSVIRSQRDGPTLDRVSLELAPGSVTAISGPSGAGKSTLADVLGGLISPSSGAFTVGGEIVTGAARRGWRERVAYVQQEPVLFHATIRENLLWAAPGAGAAELEQALRDAAAGFVFALPQGLETVVGERGASLSGGERQRIALARGLLRRPELLILDEVTSALDAANEAAVAGAVAGLRGRMTIVIIGHRGALAELADRRLTLACGRVIGEVADIASQIVTGGTRDAMEG